jgi:hypothetical protein
MNHINIFSDIYENNIWGNDNAENYKGTSGDGSTIKYNTKYIFFLQYFIKQNNIKSVADLGCGTFLCGNEIYKNLDILYTGYDAYEKIINNNNMKFENSSKFSFCVLDILNNKTNIEPADLCILKDILQHWLITEIYEFLDYIVSSKKFKYILICNCSNQTSDNLDNPQRNSALSANFLPLRKYNPKILFTYNTKEVSIIDCQ